PCEHPPKSPPAPGSCQTCCALPKASNDLRPRRGPGNTAKPRRAHGSPSVAVARRRAPLAGRPPALLRQLPALLRSEGFGALDQALVQRSLILGGLSAQRLERSAQLGDIEGLRDQDLLGIPARPDQRLALAAQLCLLGLREPGERIATAAPRPPRPLRPPRNPGPRRAGERRIAPALRAPLPVLPGACRCHPQKEEVEPHGDGERDHDPAPGHGSSSHSGPRPSASSRSLQSSSVAWSLLAVSVPVVSVPAVALPAESVPATSGPEEPATASLAEPSRA